MMNVGERMSIEACISVWDGVAYGVLVFVYSTQLP